VPVSAASGNAAAVIHFRQETDMDERIRVELEAAAFRRLREHLMEKRLDVQNIDLMNLAGFCRNCLSRWYQEAAVERGIDMSKEDGRELFYGMPYGEWKTRYQTEANDEQRSAFTTTMASSDRDRNDRSASSGI